MNESAQILTHTIDYELNILYKQAKVALDSLAVHVWLIMVIHQFYSV